MTDRSSLARAFLDQTDWANALQAPLAGDASNRKYLRLTMADTGHTAVLMDAPPAKGEDIRPFVHIARHLSSLGLSAPRIFAADEAHGFLLLEDLGDALFARVIPDTPALEPTLYAAATDLLSALHDKPLPAGLSPYSPAVMADLSALAFDWYAVQPDSAARQSFHTAILSSLSTYAADTSVLIQRDYHAENLLWLPDRSGIARVGLLDFQDAMLGHPAYDLVSLLQDARRDVSPTVEATMISRYCAASGADPATFSAAYHCLGAQRNLRILGVFARLCIRDGKPGYIDLIPRVWAHLQRDLSHPALGPVAAILRPALPAPTPETLHMLRSRCATAPAL